MTAPDSGNARLAAAGIPVDALTDEQRRMLESMSDDELAMLQRVSENIGAAKPAEALADVGVFYY